MLRAICFKSYKFHTGILNKKAYLKKENFSVSHDRRGVLSLASRRTYFNGPEFIISFQPNPWMNDKYVAFG